MIDPRTLRPLDLDTILESVRKTNRCVIVEEGWPHGGVGANLAALIQEQAFDHLDAPDRPRHRRRPADAVLQAARADRLPARAADRRSGHRDLPRPLGATRSQLRALRTARRASVGARRDQVRPQLKERRMRRTTVLGAATAAALAAGSLAVTGVLGSSHREAPEDPRRPHAPTTRTSTRSPRRTRPDSLTVVANWIPMEEPAGGPYFGKLDPEARYYVKIDNTGDGREDVAYRWKFKQRVPQPRARSWTRRRPSTRSTTRTSTSSRPTTSTRRPTATASVVARRDRIAHDVPVAPANIGPEDDPGLRQGGRRAPSARCRAAARRSSGPSDDPFFVDLGTVFDGINIDKPGRPNIGLGNQGGGKDDVVGLQHALVRPAGAGVRGHARRQVRRRT